MGELYWTHSDGTTFCKASRSEERLTPLNSWGPPSHSSNPKLFSSAPLLVHNSTLHNRLQVAYSFRHHIYAMNASAVGNGEGQKVVQHHQNSKMLNCMLDWSVDMQHVVDSREIHSIQIELVKRVRFVVMTCNAAEHAVTMLAALDWGE